MTDNQTAARNTDPDTSAEAGLKAAMGAIRVRPVVLEIIKEHGPATHDQIIGHYRHRLITAPGTPRATDSGIRTRVNELVKAGKVRRCQDESLSMYGNRAKLWEFVTEEATECTAPAYHSSPNVNATTSAEADSEANTATVK